MYETKLFYILQNTCKWRLRIKAGVKALESYMPVEYMCVTVFLASIPVTIW